MTILVALSNITADSAKPMEKMLQQVHQLLDYMYSNSNAVIRFHASAMILNVHSDASYLSAIKGRSREGEYYFLGTVPQNNKPIFLNGNIHITCETLKLVAASLAVAKLGALFVNTQELKVIRLILHEVGHPQPPIPIHIDNSTAMGIVSNMIKRQQPRAMEIRYF